MFKLLMFIIKAMLAVLFVIELIIIKVIYFIFKVVLTILGLIAFIIIYLMFGPYNKKE